MKIDNGFYLEEKKQDEFKIDHLKEGMSWAGRYANSVQLIESLVFKSEPYRYCVQDIYIRFVKVGELVAIEKLNPEDKRLFFDSSMKIFPEQVPEIHRKQLCIFLYFMNFMFEKYFVA